MASEQVVVWTDLESARKLHVRRQHRRGPFVALCGYIAPLWTHGDSVVDPADCECCKRCLAISKRRKKEWPDA